MAGIVDGEGCVGVYRQDKTKPWFSYSFQVISTDEVLIREVASVLAGLGIQLAPDYYKSGHCRQGGYWRIRAHKKRVNEAIYKALLPYLILKRPQAELSLQMLDIERRSPRDNNKLVELFEEIGRRNQRTMQSQTRADPAA